MGPKPKSHFVVVLGEFHAGIGDSKANLFNYNLIEIKNVSKLICCFALSGSSASISKPEIK